MICRNCGVESEFYKGRRVCKACVRKKHQAYRSRPDVKERQKEYHKEYKKRPEVREKRKKYIQKYNQRPEVKEKIKIYKREYEKRPHVLKYRQEYRNRPEVKKRAAEMRVKPKKVKIKKDPFHFKKYIDNGRKCRLCNENTQGNWFYCPVCYKKVCKKTNYAETDNNTAEI